MFYFMEEIIGIKNRCGSLYGYPVFPLSVIFVFDLFDGSVLIVECSRNSGDLFDFWV